ncbi:hypothetical protein BZA77DRAFT_308790 [Pyronema omphalodes]|nr:hypothetical protein BZA77DRAFT_308790 [Pyronema omphalodes]
MNTTNAPALDVYIRSLAACLSPGDSKQFIGRQKLFQLFEFSVPNSIRTKKHTFPKNEILIRLEYLLNFEGLAAELDWRTKDKRLLELIVDETHRQKLFAASADYHATNQLPPLNPEVSCLHLGDAAVNADIRSLAAGFALADNGQFIGRKKLIPLCSSSIPDYVTLGSGFTLSRDELIAQLTSLLNVGLAGELDWRARDGKLEELIKWPSDRQNLISAQEMVTANLPLRKSAIETYIKSLAAAFALGDNGQFIGRRQLVPLCDKFLPEKINLENHLFSKGEILSGLTTMLNSGGPNGLAANLDVRAKDGTLGDLIKYPSHRQLLESAKILATENAIRRKAATEKSSVTGERIPTPSETRSSTTAPSPTPSEPVKSSTDSTIPFAIQHAILPTLQSFLEEACYEYLSKEHPQVLLAKGWSMPESAELHTYAQEIQPLLPAATGTRFKSLSVIRHTAVHRIPVSFTRLFEMIEDAAYACGYLTTSGSYSSVCGNVKQPVMTMKVLALKDEVLKWMEKREQDAQNKEKAKQKIAGLMVTKSNIEMEIARLNALMNDKLSIEMEIAELEAQIINSGEEERKAIRNFKMDAERVLLSE